VSRHFVTRHATSQRVVMNVLVAASGRTYRFPERRDVLQKLAGAAFLLLVLPLHAQSGQNRMLVSTEWLHQHAGQVTVLHVGDSVGYAAGHIPGSVLIETSSILADRNGTPNELPAVSALERVFVSAGVGARERIVVYSTDVILAARAWFTLDYLGQANRTSLLDGGLVKWRADGYAISTEVARPPRGSFQARVVPQTVTSLATMRDIVRLRDQLGPNLTLLDSRPSAQFGGEEAGSGVLRAGSIPGAVSVPYASNLDVTGSFRPIDDLRRMYQQAGVAKDTANIVYCRTGMQASVTYFVLRYLGFDAALYDGSFIEWSNAGEIVWSRGG
jgi:thiosulfate/3-mercaptopyruvate sulfurtransferase